MTPRRRRIVVYSRGRRHTQRGNYRSPKRGGALGRVFAFNWLFGRAGGRGRIFRGL